MKFIFQLLCEYGGCHPLLGPTENQLLKILGEHLVKFNPILIIRAMHYVCRYNLATENLQRDNVRTFILGETDLSLRLIPSLTKIMY